jgi:outer membrane protein
VKFNLFAGGAQKARLAEAQANENKAKHDLEWVKSGVLLEVQQAYLGTKAAAQRAAAARDSANQAQESLRIIQNRYQAGLTTITELLRAQTAQLDARNAYLSAVYDWHTALVELEHSAGTLTRDAALLRGEKKP